MLSIQTPILKAQIDELGSRLRRGRSGHNREILFETVVVSAVVGCLGLFLLFIIRGSKTRPS